jgi:hypothetical protein
MGTVARGLGAVILGGVSLGLILAGLLAMLCGGKRV